MYFKKVTKFVPVKKKSYKKKSYKRKSYRRW